MTYLDSNSEIIDTGTVRTTYCQRKILILFEDCQHLTKNSTL